MRQAETLNALNLSVIFFFFLLILVIPDLIAVRCISRFSKLHLRLNLQKFKDVIKRDGWRLRSALSATRVRLILDHVGI